MAKLQVASITKKSSSTPPPSSTRLDRAIEYGLLGWKVFPLYYVRKDGGCSCGNPKCTRKGKHPLTKNGLNDGSSDPNQIQEWWTASPHSNIGLATGHEGLLVIDIDTSGTKVGAKSLAQLEVANGPMPLTLEVTTGSGGRHLYFQSPQSIPNSASRIAPDIDVRGTGGYVILPPSNHESGGHYRWVNYDAEIAPLPDWLLKLALPANSKSQSQDNINSLLLAHSETPEERAKSRPKEPDYSNLTIAQCETLLSFIDADCERDIWWKVGVALKICLGEDVGFRVWDTWSSTAPDKYDPKTNEAQWRSFASDKGITADTLVHYAKLGGFKSFDAATADTPELKDPWVYVVGIKRFVEVNTLKKWDREQYDSMFAHLYSKGKPSDHMLRNHNFVKVESCTYWPLHDRIVEEGGNMKINLWVKPLVEPVAGDVTMFIDHAKFIIPDDRERRLFLQYLAFVLRHPGQKVRWAPLLQGKQRVGKSYFGQVMTLILGSGVQRPTNERLHEPWTNWQEGAQLIVIEELMGFARQDLINKLKPMITEPSTSVRLPGGQSYEMPNRYNFLMFTNHKGALKIDEDDKRYFIVFSPSERKPDNYYDDLWSWTEANLPAIYSYFLNEVDLSDFRPNANAPETNGRSQAIEINQSDLDTWIIEGIKEQTGMFQCDLVVAEHLLRHVPNYINPREVSRKAITAALERIGAKRLRKRIKTRLSSHHGFSVRNHEFYHQCTETNLGKDYEMFLDISQGGDRADEAYMRKVNEANANSGLLLRQASETKRAERTKVEKLVDDRKPM